MVQLWGHVYEDVGKNVMNLVLFLEKTLAYSVEILIVCLVRYVLLMAVALEDQPAMDAVFHLDLPAVELRSAPPDLPAVKGKAAALVNLAVEMEKAVVHLDLPAVEVKSAVKMELVV